LTHQCRILRKSFGWIRAGQSPALRFLHHPAMAKLRDNGGGKHAHNFALRATLQQTTALADVPRLA
jgi:hypothetical protein